MEGQRDSCPLAGASRDRHAPQHARASDLAAFQLADAGICRRHRALPALPFARVFAGTMDSPHCKGWGVCLGEFGVFFIYNDFFPLFLLPCFPLASLSAAPGPQTPQAPTSTALQPSPLSQHQPTSPKQGQETRFSQGSGLPEGGKRAAAPSEQQRAVSMMCLVSLPPFKPTYEGNEGADSTGKARTTQHY